MIGSPAVGLMMDTFHANIEEKHLARRSRWPGRCSGTSTPTRTIVAHRGTGHVAWGEVGRALKKVNFSGALVIESFSTEVKEIARAAAVWRALAPTQDGLATEGMAYLKSLMQ